MRWILWVGVLLYSSINWVSAQSKVVKFRNLNSADGLSQVTIYDIFQDHRGLIWIGTSDGLNKYDGRTFEVYQHQPEDSTSISNNDIRFIFEDSKYRLWIGSSSGLDRLDWKVNGFRHYRHVPADPQSFSSNYISDMVEDRQGNLWVATKHEREHLHRFEPESGLCQRYTNPISQSPVNKMLIDSQDQIWLLHEDHSITGFSLSQKSFFRINDKLPGEPLCIFEDRQNRIWIGLDEGGVVKHQVGSDSWTTLAPGPERKGSIGNDVVRDIIEDENGHLWMATYGGLSYLDKKTDRFTNFRDEALNPVSIASNFLFCLLRDRSNRIWIGSTDAGISIIDPQTQQFQHYASLGTSQNSLSNNAVWSLTESTDRILWIGTSGGLNRLDRNTNELRSFLHDPANPRSLSHNRVWSLAAENAQTMWVGTSAGLNKMEILEDGGAAFTAYQYDPMDSTTISSNSIRNILIDRSGRFWVGTTQDGLNFFDRGTGAFKRIYHHPGKANSLSDNRIRALLEDRSDRFWIATSNGLNLFDRSTNQFQSFYHQYGDATSLSDSQVRCLAEDGNGQIWIGTERGLNLLEEVTADGKAKFRTIRVGNKLNDDRIYSLQVDSENNLWLGTNRGLLHYAPGSGTLRTYDTRDGLQANEFNQGASYSNQAGEMFFGGVNGFNIFDPLSVQPLEESPAVIFTNLSVLHADAQLGEGNHLRQHINVAEDIYLNYSDKTFSIAFTTLHFSGSQKDRFAYRLVPFEEEWVYIEGRNFAYYTNLPPGEYAFQVKAADSHGQWKETFHSIGVHIHPAFWQTWWFRTLLVLTVLLISVALYRWRIHSLLNSKHQLEVKVKERTEQLRQQKEELEGTLADLRRTQTTLIQQEKMASLGQLTAGIAHEINNPINFIASSLKALKLDFEDISPLLEKIIALPDSNPKEGALAEVNAISKSIDTPFLKQEIEELLGSIERGTYRTQSIISSLRTFSRDRRESFIKADINEAIESTLIILGNKLKKRITVAKDFGELPSVKCQISKINQALLNIIDNAIQAIEGEGQIIIGTKQEGEKVLISIRDTGTGMDMETQKKIFEPFFTTKEVGKGTGLGMAISYSIIEDHNGKIHINSELGKGTEFVVELPINP